MDMAFLRRAEQMLARAEPAPLDHRLLVASIDSLRPPPPNARQGVRAIDPLVEILVNGSARREAILAQQGCFNRAEAGRAVEEA